MSVSTAAPLALLIDKCAKNTSTSSNNQSLVVEQTIEPRVPCDGLITARSIFSSNVIVGVNDQEEEEKKNKDKQPLVNVAIDPLNEDESGSVVTTDDDEQHAPEVLVRDFGFPESSPLHYGNHPTQRWSQVSLSSAEFTGRQARALYDFVPETEYEIGMNEGDVVWVQYRQCPGWLIADVHYETGLIPESYVEFI